MILKIKLPDIVDSDGSDAKNRWRIIDKISRVRYETVRHDKKSLEDLKSLATANDNVSVIDETKNEMTFVRVFCHVQRNNDSNVYTEEFVVSFNTIGYLCNDLGQTIEKLVP